MTGLVSKAALAVVAWCLCPSIGTAQASGAPKSAPQPAPAAGTDTGAAKPSAARPMTFAGLMEAMNALPDRSKRLAKTPGLRADQITLVDVRNLFRETREEKGYEHALMKYEGQIAAMRSTLESNSVLRALLKDWQLSVAHVVAVDTSPDGRALVYYQPE